MGPKCVAMRAAWTLALLAIGASVSRGAEPRPLALVDLDGRPVEVALRRNEAAVLLHFWATWCPSCVEELAVLDAAARTCPAEVRVVAVNVAEAPATIRSFLSNLPIAMDVLRDETGDVWRQISGRGLPTNLVWTQSTQRIETGPRDAAAWASLLGELGCD